MRYYLLIAAVFVLLSALKLAKFFSIFALLTLVVIVITLKIPGRKK